MPPSVPKLCPEQKCLGCSVLAVAITALVAGHFVLLTCMAWQLISLSGSVNILIDRVNQNHADNAKVHLAHTEMITSLKEEIHGLQSTLDRTPDRRKLTTMFHSGQVHRSHGGARTWLNWSRNRINFCTTVAFRRSSSSRLGRAPLSRFACSLRLNLHRQPGKGTGKKTKRNTSPISNDDVDIGRDVCSDVANTHLELDNGTAVQCVDLREDCHDGQSADAIKALCPVTCGTCNTPCNDVFYTTFTDADNRSQSCSEIMQHCYGGSLRDLVTRLCPVTCGVCSFIPPIDILNSSVFLERSLHRRSALDQNLPQLSPRLASPIWGHGEAWRIPQVFHQTWKTDWMPEKYAEHILSWRRLHPHWRFEFWDDRRSRELVSTSFPEYLEQFDKMSGIKQADVTRIVALYIYGGVYADIDVEAARSFDDLLEAAGVARAGVLLGEENIVHTILLERRFSARLVSNAVMASAAGHPFWLEALKEIFLNNNNCGDDPVLCTGPRLIDRLSLRQATCNEFGCVLRLPYDYFSPYIARWNADAMATGCWRLRSMARNNLRRNELLAMACRGFEQAVRYPAALRSEKTFAIHHWQCSWCREDSALSKKIPLSDLIWRFGNETLEDFCRVPTGESTHNSHSVLFNYFQQIRQPFDVLEPIHSQIFVKWLFRTYPGFCQSIVARNIEPARTVVEEDNVVNAWSSQLVRKARSALARLWKLVPIYVKLDLFNERALVLLAMLASSAITLIHYFESTKGKRWKSL